MRRRGTTAPTPTGVAPAPCWESAGEASGWRRARVSAPSAREQAAMAGGHARRGEWVHA